MATRKDIRLDVDAFEEAPVVGDPALIRELFIILLDNAVKFTRPGGRITMSVSMRSGLPTIMLTDSGVGIDAGDLPRLFDRFYRGSHRDATHDGAGLGLSIAKWIADQHGAKIDVQSEPDRGTTVTVSFPVPARAAADLHAT